MQNHMMKKEDVIENLYEVDLFFWWLFCQNAPSNCSRDIDLFG